MRGCNGDPFDNGVEIDVEELPWISRANEAEFQWLGLIVGFD
jgi:hypothetical protein